MLKRELGTFDRDMLKTLGGYQKEIRRLKAKYKQARGLLQECLEHIEISATMKGSRIRAFLDGEKL